MHCSMSHTSGSFDFFLAIASAPQAWFVTVPLHTQLTHVLMEKHGKSGKPFEWSEKRKDKVKAFIKEQMARCGPVYERKAGKDGGLLDNEYEPEDMEIE